MVTPVRSVGASDTAAGVFGLLAADTMRIARVRYGNGLGMLVLHMMLFGMDLFVFFKVLRTFEALIADGAVVRLQGGVDCGFRREHFNSAL